MDRDAYQLVSPSINLLAMTTVVYWRTHPQLAWSFFAVADPDYLHPVFAYLNFQRTPAADFAVGERSYAVYSHDWRAEPLPVWDELLAERALQTDQTVEMLEATRPAAPLVLSQPDFAEAVRRALRDYQRPAALTANPLLRSRLARTKAVGAPTPDALQALIRDAVESLKGNPRDEKLYRAVRRTYLEPAATQELAAESLGLPFGTYRSQLSAGLARITEWLWLRELDGTED